MTVDMTAPAPLPDPADYGFTVVAESGLPAEHAALAERVRRLVDATAHSTADPAVLAEAAEEVDRISALLEGARRETGAMLHRRVDGRDEYTTLTNAVGAELNPAAPPLRLAGAAEGVRGEVVLGGAYQGPPGLVHGGWIAALLDQAMGHAAVVLGMPGLTANLSVDYRRPTPLGRPVEVTGRVTGTERRKVFVAGEVRVDGELTAEGTAVMVRILPLR
ncbi:PaaI family thioesterase [Allonocardiopsis opalescens]|uniref:Acyl-coenzyme A thioesterase THEM4 n=1 Tax=Allonocardiopsis opalescens TaxID=1144618 RepID=A0A2T0Q0A3_9ACTN|nr:PaaI family thioesterase [Allonocardiopsis opalescens]PRX97229.1 thioesterase superfamily protein [Allonocardiopsis opalescens]